MERKSWVHTVIARLTGYTRQSARLKRNLTVKNMKNDVLWMLRCMALVRTDVSEEHSASLISVTRFLEQARYHT
jgi:hypothetical protein